VKVIAFHVQHDASVAVADSGRLLLVLELERLFEERYFASALDDETFREQWTRALTVLRDATGIDQFDVAVTSWVMPAKRRVLQQLVRAAEWKTVDHHVAHALHGLYDAPFERPLIVSFDGGGNDGTFRVFHGERQSGRLTAIARPRLNLGTPYRLLATAMPEVTGRHPQPHAGHLSLAGKLMAYAALAAPRPEWLAPIEEYYRTYQEPTQALYSLGEDLGLDLDANALSDKDARALAATSQAVFEALLVGVVSEHIEAASVNGIVLTGGCALNVVSNERVRRAFSEPVHVPPAPNDAGISVGALWSVAPAVGAHGPFVGLDLIRDVDEPELVARGGQRSTIDDVARLILAGAIIGIARGRAELGPRALGNRSIVAAADRPELRERINSRIKSREWYRPIAPAILAEAASHFFEDAAPSPHMSFAARVRASEHSRLAGALHVNGTARVQTVEDRGSVLGSLLVTLERLGATPCVLNTSFNVQGRPLLQRASAALEALDRTDLDFAWVDGWLVPRSVEILHRFGTSSKSAGRA
jgi:carbamoyltransferase